MALKAILDWLLGKEEYDPEVGGLVPKPPKEKVEVSQYRPPAAAKTPVKINAKAKSKSVGPSPTAPPPQNPPRPTPKPPGDTL